jgi:hypothetical protein
MSRTIMGALAALSLSLLLPGCTGTSNSVPAISFYDDCAKQTHSFVEMAACGKRNRNNHCQAANLCSGDGDALVLYTDALAKSVASHEMSEAQAQIKWVEFRNSRQQIEATRANKPPTSCITTDGITNCY